MVTSPFEYYVKVNGFFFSWTDATCILLSMLPFTDAWIKDWQLHTRIHVHCLYAAAALFIQAECRVQWGSGPNFKAFRFAWSSTVKVSRVRGPIVFGWSLLTSPPTETLSHNILFIIILLYFIIRRNSLTYCCIYWREQPLT